MQLSELLTPDRIVCDLPARSKKRVLEAVGELIAAHINNITAIEIFDCLLARERLGGTGIGHGIAIPHGRLKNLQNAIGAFIKLDEAVDFDSIDREPVDLVFALLVPENSTEEHLQILASIAGLLNDETIRERLRNANNADELGKIISEGNTSP